MKKNISTNLQGIIFHIEEDGFDALSRYLAEVKAHFANYQGHDEIVADIEARIAELFVAQTSPIRQVITLEDVQAMMTKMGRVRDFAPEADEDDEPVAAETADSGTTGGTAGPNGPFGPKGTFGTDGPFGPKGPFAVGTEPDGSPKRLYRDMANRKIAGVAAGIAQYFALNPLWIRLGFVFFALLSPAVWRVFDGFDMDRHFNLRFGSWAVIAYVVLWVVLPKRYDAPAPTEALLTSGPLAGRRLFRDTGAGKVAGVSAGLAAYFNVDVTLVRVVFLAGLLAGGFTFLLYIILWIALPEAKTVSDKLRMRGDAVNLESFDSSARSSAFSEAPTTNRPVGAFVEDAARNLRPAVSFVGSAIRIFAGVLLTLMGFGCLVAMAVALGAGVGLLPHSQNIVLGDAPAHVILKGIPTWGLLAGFFAAGIPALALLLGGLSLLFRTTIMPRTVGLSLLGLWLLSIVGVVMTVAQQSREYQYDEEVEQLERYPRLTTPVLLLDARNIDRQWEQHVSLRLAPTDSGKVVEVLRTLRSKGSSEEDARRNALTTIDYTIRTSGDSALVFDDHFSFLPDARYRDQELAVTVRLPRDRTFRLSRKFAYNLLRDENFVNNHRPKDPEQHRYRLRGNKLECVGCTDEQLGKEENEDDDVNINVDVDNDGDDNSSDDSSNDDDDSSSNYGGAPAFNTDLSSYGDARRTFQETGFNRVSVVGGYRVVVRHGNTFKVEAGGDQSALNDLRVERDGDELLVKPRNSGSFFGGNWGRNQRKVLVVINLPALERLELAGAVHADLGGFERQGELRVEQAGASHLLLNGNYGTLRLEQAGACRTTATGHADELNLEAAGACELAAANLQARNVTVSVAGACKARLNATESIKGDAVGVSEIAYSGNPGSVKVESTGPSSIKRL